MVTLIMGGSYNTKEETMNSILKGFYDLFSWITPRTTREQLNDLDDSMQKLYNRMGWGKYHKPSHKSGWNDACDLNRVLEAEQTFMDEIYDYNSKQVSTTIKKTFSNKRDVARPRRNKYL